MRTMAGTAVVAGVAVLALVLAVTVLSVTFATRGAMATNRPIIEVLHYVGATDGFIAGQFQRHFLLLGFKGGAIGGGAAILLFGVVRSGERLARRDCGRRRGRGVVRQLLHRRCRLPGDRRADRTDGHGDGAGFAPDRQSHPGDDRLTAANQASTCRRNCGYDRAPSDVDRGRRRNLGAGDARGDAQP